MAGIRSMGAKLKYTDGGEQFITHLTSLGEISLENTSIDVTDHDSPDGKKESIAGEQQYGNISISGNIVNEDDTFDRIWALANNQKNVEMEAVYANKKTAKFTGHFLNVKMGEQTTDGLMTYSGEIEITGQVVFANAEE